FLVQSVDGRFKLNHAERSSWPDNGLLPPPAVKEKFARMRFIVARPLDPTQSFQPGVAHPGVHWAQTSDFIPDVLRTGIAPIVSQYPRQLAQTRNIIPRSDRRIEGLAPAFYPAIYACRSPL